MTPAPPLLRWPRRLRQRAVTIGILLSATVAGACAAPLTSREAAAAHFQSDRITVTTRGSGPDVVLIHGLASSAAEVWAGTVAAVPGYRYHLVQVHGFAGVPAGRTRTAALSWGP